MAILNSKELWQERNRLKGGLAKVEGISASITIAGGPDLALSEEGRGS